MTPEIITRKRICLVTFVCMSLLPLATRAADGDFDVIKQRILEELLETPVDDGRVKDILVRMKSDGSFSDINYDDLSRTAGFPHRRHTGDLVYLAEAYRTRKSKYYKRKDLKARIATSLQYWVDHDFFGDNWHDNQITTPTNLVNLMLLIGDELPADLVKKAQPIIGRANMSASGARPSGDRIVIAGILAKNQLFLRDNEGLSNTIRIIEGELKFNTGKRGLQQDYSFHHRVDRVNNTTSYGYGKYANTFGEWSYYVSGTRFAFSEEKIKLLIDYYLEGVYKQLVYGMYTDVSVENRSISQKKSRFQPHGVAEIERLLVSTDYRKKELEEIMRLRKGEAKPSQSFCKFFWQTEHFVFQRPDFYTTVRMFSTRNRTMEEPYNGPGITTHHRADGTNYLMRKGDEYFNIWPVYDWQKISGTTILQRSHLPGADSIQMEGLTDFVGAVTDGLYGAVAFDFRSPHDLVAAKKSWFFFDHEYVCIGTDIHSTRNLPVVTTMNQTLLRSDVTVMQDRPAARLPRGDRELKDVKCVYQDGVGYIFPTPATVHLSNQTEHGRWSDITAQKNISQEVVDMDVFKLWIDHGKRPQDAAYEYVVVPDVSEQELFSADGLDRGIEILSKTSDIHAVVNRKLGLCQIAFYKSGEVKISDGLSVGMESQGMAMVRINANKVTELTVADPSRKLNSVMVTLSGIYQAKGDHFLAIPDSGKGVTRIIVDLPHGVYAGKSITIALK